MAKLTLDTVAGGYDLSIINNNFDKIETAFENTLSRDGTTPNTLGANLDVNNKALYNVASLATNSLTLAGQAVTLSTLNVAGIDEILNYSALRAYTGSEVTFLVKGHTIALDGGGGIFRYDPTDTTSADNGGTILVDASGRRWKRELESSLSLRKFGAKLDGVTDDTQALRAAIAEADARPNGLEIIIDGHARITDTITIASFRKVVIKGISAAAMITFDNVTPDKPLFFLANQSSFTRFENLIISDANVRTSTAIAISGDFVAGITNWKNMFVFCRFEYFAVGVHFSTTNPLNGTTHAQGSENTFLHCKFRDCAIGIKNSNLQSVNNNFYGVDIENTYDGDTESIMIQDNAGGGMFFYGGSFISRGRAIQLRYPAGGSTLWADGSIVLTGVRFEVRTPHVGVLIDDDPTAQSPGSRFAAVIFNNCFLLNTVAGGVDLLRYSGRLHATFRGTNVASNPAFIRQFPVTGRSASDSFGSQGEVHVDSDCRGISAVKDLTATYGATNNGYFANVYVASQKGTQDKTVTVDAYGFKSSLGARGSVVGRSLSTATPNRLVYNDPKVTGGFTSQKIVLPVNAIPLKLGCFKNPLRIADAFQLKLYLVKDLASWATPGVFNAATDAVIVADTGSTAGKAGAFEIPVQISAAWFGGQHMQVGEVGWEEGRAYIEISGSANPFSGMVWVDHF